MSFILVPMRSLIVVSTLERTGVLGWEMHFEPGQLKLLSVRGSCLVPAEHCATHVGIGASIMCL